MKEIDIFIACLAQCGEVKGSVAPILPKLFICSPVKRFALVERFLFQSQRLANID
jgi:hypothetical protein